MCKSFSGRVHINPQLCDKPLSQTIVSELTRSSTSVKWDNGEKHVMENGGHVQPGQPLGAQAPQNLNLRGASW